MQPADHFDGPPQSIPPSLVEAYEQTQFRVDLPSGTVVLTVGPSQIESQWLPNASLTVITAHNPGSQRPCDAANERANERLEQRLKAAGWRYYPAIGESRDHSHAEASFAVLGISRGEARDLGEALGQACVLYWEDGRGTLLWSRTS